MAAEEVTARATTALRKLHTRTGSPPTTNKMSHAPNNSHAPSVEPSPEQQGQPRALALAAGSEFWESPALKLRSRHYPEHFEDRVPLTIRMRFNVRADAWCGAIGGKPGTILRGGEVYPAWTNSHGAVCGICANGERLGVKPDEFEVEEWYTPNTKDEPGPAAPGSNP